MKCLTKVGGPNGFDLSMMLFGTLAHSILSACHTHSPLCKEPQYCMSSHDNRNWNCTAALVIKWSSRREWACINDFQFWNNNAKFENSEWIHGVKFEKQTQFWRIFFRKCKVSFMNVWLSPMIEIVSTLTNEVPKNYLLFL